MDLKIFVQIILDVSFIVFGLITYATFKKVYQKLILIAEAVNKLLDDKIAELEQRGE